MLCPLMTPSEHHADPLLTCRFAANVVIPRLANPTAKASSLMLVAVRATR
jgi:hypothetical protein